MIHETAVVHPSAVVGDNVTIGPFCEVGPFAVIGDGCRLENCTVEGEIGAGTKVWRYAHVMKDAVVGKDCQVCNGAIVLSTANVGDRCDIQLWAGIARYAVLGNDVYVGPNVVFCNAKRPKRGAAMQQIIVRDGASIGANSSIMGGVVIGAKAVIGAGSVVTKDIPDGEMWTGLAATKRLPRDKHGFEIVR